MMLTNADTEVLALPLSRCSRMVASLLASAAMSTIFVAFAGEQFVQIFRRAMEFLRAEHQIHVRQFINQFLSAALRHAAHEADNLIAFLAARRADDVLHLVDGFLLGEIAHAAGVQQNHVGGRLGLGERIAFGYELGGDGFAVALVHLASVSFDENTGHFPGQQHSTAGADEKLKHKHAVQLACRRAAKLYAHRAGK